MASSIGSSPKCGAWRSPRGGGHRAAAPPILQQAGERERQRAGIARRHERSPVSGTTASRVPPTSVATCGTPHACASSTPIGNASHAEGGRRRRARAGAARRPGEGEEGDALVEPERGGARAQRGALRPVADDRDPRLRHRREHRGRRLEQHLDRLLPAQHRHRADQRAAAGERDQARVGLAAGRRAGSRCGSPRARRAQRASRGRPRARPRTRRRSRRWPARARARPRARSAAAPPRPRRRTGSSAACRAPGRPVSRAASRPTTPALAACACTSSTRSRRSARPTARTAASVAVRMRVVAPQVRPRDAAAGGRAAHRRCGSPAGRSRPAREPRAPSPSASWVTCSATPPCGGSQTRATRAHRGYSRSRGADRGRSPVYPVTPMEARLNRPLDHARPLALRVGRRQGNDEPVEVRRYVDAIRRGRWLILTLAVSAALVAFVLSSLAPDRYTATARSSSASRSAPTDSVNVDSLSRELSTIGQLLVTTDVLSRAASRSATARRRPRCRSRSSRASTPRRT